MRTNARRPSGVTSAMRSKRKRDEEWEGEVRTGRGQAVGLGRDEGRTEEPQEEEATHRGQARIGIALGRFLGQYSAKPRGIHWAEGQSRDEQARGVRVHRHGRGGVEDGDQEGGQVLLQVGQALCGVLPAFSRTGSSSS